MNQFPTAGHLISWAKLSPRTIQSGTRNRTAKTGKGNPYLKRVLGEAAASAARTDTFLGERYRRLVKRRGKLKALVGVARSILVIIWHLLVDPTARFHDLGGDFYTRASRRSAAPATSSTSSRSSATTSPSPPRPEHTTPPTRCTAGGSLQRAHLRASPSFIFGSGTGSAAPPAASTAAAPARVGHGAGRLLRPRHDQPRSPVKPRRSRTDTPGLATWS